MEEKEIINEVELEIEQDDAYEDLLKKFEEPQTDSKPKKNLKPLGIILSVIIIAALAGALFFLIFSPQNNDSSIESQEAEITCETDENKTWQAQAEITENGKVKKNGTGYLVEYLPKNIKNIKIENALGSYSLDSYTPKNATVETDPETGETSEETSKTEYTLKGYEDFKLEDGSPDDVANDCASIQFTNIISPDATDTLGDYGLDKPRVVATITYTDKTKAVLKVGNDALQGAGTYVSFGNSNAVYLVAPESVDSLLWGVEKLISKTINETSDNTDNANFKSLELTGKAYGEKIVMEPNNDTDSIANSYLLTSPRKIFADDTEASSVSGGIRGLLATDVVCLNPKAKDIKKYGLADNYAHLVAKYPDVTINLFASKPDSEGNCYIMENGGQIIYQIPSTSISWVNTNAKNLESDYFINPKLQGLSQMSVQTNKKYDFLLNTTTTPTTDEQGNATETTETSVVCGTAPITLGNFETYLGNVGLITKANSNTTKPTGKADLTITYEYSGKRDTDTVKFFKTSDDKHIVTVNSLVAGQVYSSYVEKIIQQTPEIAADKNIKSFW